MSGARYKYRLLVLVQFALFIKGSGKRLLAGRSE